MKKILALTLALCLVFVLCACGTGATPEVTSDSGTAASNSKTVDTETVAVGAVIIARDDVPEDEIYTLVKTIFENKDEISQMHAKGEELDVDVAASITSVPYHPGAAKYFAEKGIEVASVKDNWLRKHIHRFDAINATKVRINVTETGDNQTARIMEVRIYNE